MSEQGIGEQHMIKCGHQSCKCLVQPSQSYCSDWCASSSTSATSAELPGEPHTGACQCKHPGCQPVR